MASVKKMITVAPEVIERAQKIQKDRGYSSFSGLVTEAIYQLYEKMYKYQTRAYIPQTSETKAEKSVQTQVLKEKLSKEQGEAEWMPFVKALNGEVTLDAVGNKYCKWNNYAIFGNSVSKFEQELPVGQLSQILVDNQYDPSRERVEEILNKSN